MLINSLISFLNDNKEIINSILNLVANLLLFIGGFLFYYHHISNKLPKITYYSLRIFTAFLVTGALSRVIFDFNIIITGQNNNFDIIEAAIALTRNFGLGGILMYCVIHMVAQMRIIKALKNEVELLKNELRKR